MKESRMQLPIYQIDAFASGVFAGNPAAVCPLENWLPDATMQSIALENNLSETAFFCPEGDGYRLRWFTPALEVDLCGHATLATAYLLFNRLTPEANEVRFLSRSGPLRVTREGDVLELDFPAQPPVPAPTPAGLDTALSVMPLEYLMSGNRSVAVLESESQIRALAPDMAAVATLAPGGLLVTAPGDRHDFVSRYFAPSKGIPEDPVTGSAHTASTPYWATRLGKTTLTAAQLSARGGELTCTLEGDRVKIAGKAVLYMEGTIHL
jgi:PhzF family phenazine biosynthesis protein